MEQHNTQATTPQPPDDDDDIQVAVVSELACPELGEIVVTPAALAKLNEISVDVKYLLYFHSYLVGGYVDELSLAASQSLLPIDTQVKTELVRNYGDLLVVTEAVNTNGKNHIRTRVLLPEEA